jgi:hypothetical protein
MTQEARASNINNGDSGDGKDFLFKSKIRILISSLKFRKRFRLCQ